MPSTTLHLPKKVFSLFSEEPKLPDSPKQNRRPRSFVLNQLATVVEEEGMTFPCPRRGKPRTHPGGAELPIETDDP